LWGFAIALVVTVYSQTMPRITCSPYQYFTGAPQGLDEWTYFSMIRAIWRTGNGFTYSYPYAWGPTPPVLFHLHFAILALVARFTGLPAAFEIGRVLGASATGAAIQIIATRLVPKGQLRRWFYVAAVAGGGLFFIADVFYAIHVAGIDGLTEILEYGRYAQGILYWWLPYLGLNLRMPLECIYHAFVMLGLAFLITGRPWRALACGAATWMCNPFSGVALSVPVICWWASRAIFPVRLDQLNLRPPRPSASFSSQLRTGAIVQIAAWTGITLAAVIYNGPFLNQWAVFRGLKEQYWLGSTIPIAWWRVLMLVMPWILVLLWVFFSSRGRRMVLWNPNVRLFLFMIPWHILLLRQDVIVGEKHLQELHYNRGYLQFALVVVTWQWVRTIAVWARMRWHTSVAARHEVWPRMRHRLLPACVLLLCLDQGMFVLKQITDHKAVGYVPVDFAKAIHMLPDDALGRTVYNDGVMRCSSYITAASNYVAYMADETMVVPFPEERAGRLEKAMASGKGLAQLGIGYAIIDETDTMSIEAFLRQGWAKWRLIDSEGKGQGIVILRPPDLSGKDTNSGKAQPPAARETPSEVVN
jgi:hypothetical protein